MSSLALVSCIKYPGGFARAMGAAMVDETLRGFITQEGKITLFFDCFPLILFTLFLFASIQIFAGAGRESKRFCPAGAGTTVMAFAAGSAIGWLAYGLMALGGMPPAVMLVLACSGLLKVSENKKMGGALCSWSIACSVCVGLVGAAGNTLWAGQDNSVQSSSWYNSSRVDIRQLHANGEIKGVEVDIDRFAYQFLPTPELRLAETANKSLDYRQIPYMAMPNMSGKNALILRAGLGTDVAEGLSQGLSHITAVEAQKWLTDIASQQPYAPYSNSKVSLVTDDPRHFLRNTKDKYDLILFTGNPATNRPDPFISINQDDFLYTVESIGNAYDRLNDNGQLVIASSADNEVIKVRLACNVLAAIHRVDAELTTKYGNYLVVGKTKKISASTVDRLNALRQELGANVVSYVEWTLERARHSGPSFDDQPFIRGYAPGLPQADMFFITMTILVMLLSLRIHARQSMLQNISREKCRIFLLAVSFMVLFCKALMLITFHFGIRPEVMYTSIGCNWSVLFMAVFLSSKPRLCPRWAWRTALVIALLCDNGFTLDGPNQISDLTVRVIASMVTPYLPAFFAAGLLGHELNSSKEKGQFFGLILIGFAVGCLLSLGAMLEGIGSLDMLILGIVVLTLLIGPPRAGKIETVSQ